MKNMFTFSTVSYLINEHGHDRWLVSKVSSKTIQNLALANETTVQHQQEQI